MALKETGMSKEGEIVARPAKRSLWSLELYKRSQGRVTRQATFGAVALLTALAAWSMHFHIFYLFGSESVRYVADLVVLALGCWLAFRLVNMPRFADFLISVEAEMSKVSWPTRQDLVRTSMVVMVMIFGLAAVLFIYDLIWREILQFIGVM